MQPFSDTGTSAPIPGVDPAASPQPVQQSAPAPAAPAPDTAAQAMEVAAELRAEGTPREQIIRELSVLQVSEAAANNLIDEADLFAGMMGRPHPADINPHVREQIDAKGPMMVTDSLANQQATSGPANIDRDQVIATAKSMIEESTPVAEVIDYLVLNGAPPDQARDLAGRLASDFEAAQPKKKSGFFRR